MLIKIKRVLFVVLLLVLVSSAFSEKTSIESLYRYKLENGLELFVVENDSAPLAYIEIAVRVGAVTQTPETAGLFHLYEHMMFKGNSKYANQDAFNDAANEMGRIDENGSTGIDRVNYYFTVPSSQIRNALEFWSYAVRTPKMDETELENEKSVVLSEINANFTDPYHIRSASISKTMFPNGAWRVDPSGSPLAVKNATVESLRSIQKKYYIPSNSAIFIGGDVKHNEVFQYVKEIYSDWENYSESTALNFKASKQPVSSDKKMVFVNPGSSDGMIQVSYVLRGPDGETDSFDTYPADVWVNLINSPDSMFADVFLSEKNLEIPESDYIGASYPTSRASGLISFYAVMLNSQNAKDSLNPFEKSEKFLSILKEKGIKTMLDKTLFFKNRSVDFVIQMLEDNRTYELESAKGVLSSLSYFWAACGSDYFFDYDKNIASVTEDDVVSFVKKYIQNKSGVYVVSVSPGIWEKYEKYFISNGYEKITAEKAFWHNDYETKKVEKK